MSLIDLPRLGQHLVCELYPISAVQHIRQLLPVFMWIKHRQAADEPDKSDTLVEKIYDRCRVERTSMQEQEEQQLSSTC